MLQLDGIDNGGALAASRRRGTETGLDHEPAANKGQAQAQDTCLRSLQEEETPAAFRVLIDQ